MAGSVSSQFRPTPRRVAYALAFLLPGFCSYLTVRFAVLHAFPAVLQFLVVIVVSTLGGLFPGLVAVVLSAVARTVQMVYFPIAPFSTRQEVIRLGIFVLAVIIITLLSRRRVRSEVHLTAALAQLQERSDALLDALTGNKCACWTIDLDSGKSARWFAASYELFGRPYAELEQMPSLTPLLHPDDQPRLVELAQLMRSTPGPLTFEHRTVWPNGELHTLEMRGHRVPGTGCIWRGITVDITERKLTEAALVRAEKLAAMGRLASTVAHEINNPLEAVTNLLYLARSDQSMQPATQDYLVAAERELSRLSNITRLTLGFVRTSGSVADVSIAYIADEVISIFQHRLDTKHVTVERDYQKEVRITIAPHELRQVATNLIANAADAVARSGGFVRVTVRAEGPLAVFCVEDNGSGIAAADLPHIFEPFFSTKEEIGTGIGLWVTRELVEKNGGKITVNSGDLPHGIHTCFRIEFPLAPRVS